MSIPVFEVSRRGPVNNPVVYWRNRTLMEVAVFIIIAAAVFTYLFAPTLRGK